MPPKTRPTSNLLRAIAKPDSSGTSPGMTEGAHSGTTESEGTGDVARP